MIYSDDVLRNKILHVKAAICDPIHATALNCIFAKYLTIFWYLRHTFERKIQFNIFRDPFNKKR